MQVTVLTLQLLLDCSHSSKGRRDGLDDETRDSIPGEDHSGTFPSYQFGQLSAEQPYIEDGLGQVHVQASKRYCPFLCVGSEALIRVANAAVQVADLIVVHTLKIVVVEVQG